MNRLGWTLLGMTLAAFLALAGFALDLMPIPAGAQRPAKVIVTFDSEAESLKQQLAQISLERDRLAADLSAVEADQDALLEDLSYALAERDRLRQRLELNETGSAKAESGPVPVSVPRTEASPGPPSVEISESYLVPEAGPAAPALPSPAGLMDQGLRAYRNGDFQRAFDSWMPLARAGNLRAQFFIGGLYNDGSGVSQDLIEAYIWLRRSDRGGYRRAETLLAAVVRQMTASEVDLAERRLAEVAF